MYDISHLLELHTIDAMARNPNYIKMIKSYHWQQLRDRKIKSQPLCQRCLEGNRTTAATEVHHIVPVETAVSFEQMQRLMFDYNNLMSVCKLCHTKLHESLKSFDKETVKKNNKRTTARFINHFFKQ